MSRLPRAAGLLRAHPGLTVGAGIVLLPVGVLLSLVVIGLPLVSGALTSLMRQLLQAARARAGHPAPERHGRSWGGALATLLLAGFGVGALLAVGALEHLVGGALGDVPSILLGVAVYVGLGAAASPLLFAPLLAADGAKLFEAFSLSFQVAARLGARASARLGAQVGGALALGLLPAAAVAHASPAATVIVAPFAIALGAPLAIALLADAIAEAQTLDQRAEDTAAPPDVPAGLRGIFRLLAPGLAGVGAAVLVAAATPLPLAPWASDIDAPQRGLRTDVQLVPQRLPGTTVQVSARPHGLRIEADDGGGAGEVELPLEGEVVGVMVVERAEPAGTFVVAATDGAEWVATVVDADGVRLDDTLARRVFVRLGRVGTALLAAGLLVLLWLVFSVGSELGTARALDVPDLLAPRPEGPAGGGGLRALGGTLRLGDGARVFYGRRSALARLFDHAAAGRLVVEGEAWLEADGGQFRLRLPERPVRVLEGVASDWEGVHVVVLSRFAGLASASLRTSSVPWPDDAVITLGRGADAARALLARAAKRASWLALPILGCLGVAVAILVTRL